MKKRQDQIEFSEKAVFYGIAVIVFIIFIGWLKYGN